MKLTILGSEPAWPSAGGVCSGYILETEPGQRILIDCGTGVFARLREMLAPEYVSAIVISHVHFDHWADLIPFRYYLRYEAGSDNRPPLYLPPGAAETLRNVVAPVDQDPDFFAGNFRIAEYDPTAGLELAGAELTFRRTRHPVETYAIAIRQGDRRLCYSADTGWDPVLATFASGSDLFVCEAAWGGGASQGEVHLTGAEAGRLAAMAGAKKLLLTHLSEPAAIAGVEAAKMEFEGPVEYARAGSSHAV